MTPKAFSSSTLIFLAVLVALLVGTQGAAKRIVVDDADTRILYSSNGWATETTCPACFPQLDMNQVRNRTWHFSNNTADSGFTFFFTGPSVELRYIASDTVQLLAQRVNYTIDGVQYPIAAQSQPLDPISFAYNQSLFNVTGLANTAHTLQVNIVQSSSLLIDYLIYEEMNNITSTNSSPTSRPSSTPDVSPSNSGSTSSTNLGAIIGGVVSGVVLLVLGIVLFFFLKRRRRAQLSETVAPYVESTSAGVTTPELRNFTGHPKHHSLNTGTSVANQVQSPLPDQPVEAGLMSRSRFPTFPSDGSRRIPTAS